MPAPLKPLKFKELRRSLGLNFSPRSSRKHVHRHHHEGGFHSADEWDREHTDYEHEHDHDVDIGDFAAPISPISAASAASASRESLGVVVQRPPSPLERDCERRRRRWSAQPERKRSNPRLKAVTASVTTRKRAGTVGHGDDAAAAATAAAVRTRVAASDTEVCMTIAPPKRSVTVQSHPPAAAAAAAGAAPSKPPRKRPTSWTLSPPRWANTSLPTPTISSSASPSATNLPRSESTSRVSLVNVSINPSANASRVSLSRSSASASASRVSLVLALPRSESSAHVAIDADNGPRSMPQSPTAAPAPLVPILKMPQPRKATGVPTTGPVVTSPSRPLTPPMSPPHSPVVSTKTPRTSVEVQRASIDFVPVPARKPEPKRQTSLPTPPPTSAPVPPAKDSKPPPPPPPLASSSESPEPPSTPINIPTSPASTRTLAQRIWPSDKLEQRPGPGKKPAPGRVFIFDVVTEEPTELTFAPGSPSTSTALIPAAATARATPAVEPTVAAAYAARIAESQRRNPIEFRTSPWLLAGTSLAFFASNMELIPRMFVVAGGRRPARGETTVISQATMIAVSSLITVLGAASLLACVPTFAAICLFALIADQCQGPPTRVSERPDIEPAPGAEREQWFFVNGIATTGTGAQESVDFLHGLVHRPVTAIMNRSLGLWFDLLQCVVQRDLRIPTKDLREGYKYIHEAVTNRALDRVVLVAHSQGAILASAWIDQLVEDMPPSLLARVEVYTFGSAANHFSLSVDSLARVEHFANMYDFVAQYGVLEHARGGAFAPSVDDTVKAVYGRYPGRVFARNRTGHMLLEHYLHPADSVLDDPDVRAASRLARYVGGGCPPPAVPAARRPGGGCGGVYGGGGSSSRSSSGSATLVGSGVEGAKEGDSTPCSTDRDGPAPAAVDKKKRSAFKFGGSSGNSSRKLKKDKEKEKEGKK